MADEVISAASAVQDEEGGRTYPMEKSAERRKLGNIGYFIA